MEEKIEWDFRYIRARQSTRPLLFEKVGKQTNQNQNLDQIFCITFGMDRCLSSHERVQWFLLTQKKFVQDNFIFFFSLSKVKT